MDVGCRDVREAGKLREGPPDASGPAGWPRARGQARAAAGLGHAQSFLAKGESLVLAATPVGEKSHLHLDLGPQFLVLVLQALVQENLNLTHASGRN